MIGIEVDNLSTNPEILLAVLAQTDDESWAFLGEDSLAWLVLAFGAAMVVGNVLALLRPPAQTDDGTVRSVPLARTIVMIAIGGVASLWGIASLIG